MYAATGPDEEVTKQIERYHILQKGTAKGYKLHMSTFDSMNHDFFYASDDEVEQTKLGRLNPNGSYIKNMIKMIESTKHPLGIHINGSDGYFHDIVLRNDKKPDVMEDGWIRYYVYDPNQPYLSDAYIEEFSKKPVSYYVNYLTEDRYIELNPEINQWRYFTTMTLMDINYQKISLCISTILKKFL